MRKRKKHSLNTKIKRNSAMLFAVMCLTLLSFPAFAVFASAGSPPSCPEIVFPVTVRVTGEAPYPSEEYCIRLTPTDNAPMPAVGEDYIIIKEPGTAVFPPVSYRTVGVYRYAISQIAGKNPNIHYDESVYDVTVTVVNSEEDDGLKLTAVIIKDGKKQDTAEFVNEYSPDRNILEDKDIPGKEDVPPEGPTVDPPPADDPVTPPADDPSVPPSDDPVNPPPADDPATPPLDEPVTPPADETVESFVDPPANAPNDVGSGTISVQTDRLPGDTLIQTGQPVLPVLLLGCVGTALIVIGLILSGGKRRSVRKRKGANRQ